MLHWREIFFARSEIRRLRSKVSKEIIFVQFFVFHFLNALANMDSNSIYRMRLRDAEDRQKAFVGVNEGKETHGTYSPISQVRIFSP